LQLYSEMSVNIWRATKRTRVALIESASILSCRRWSHVNAISAIAVWLASRRIHIDTSSKGITTFSEYFEYSNARALWKQKPVVVVGLRRQRAVESVCTRQLENCEHYHATRSHPRALPWERERERGSIRRLQLTRYSRAGANRYFSDSREISRRLGPFFFFRSLVRISPSSRHRA